MPKLHRLILLPLVAGLFWAAAMPVLADGGNDFVCPVFNSSAAVGEKNPNAQPIGGGDSTIIPGANTGTPRANQLDVPDLATNMDGAGSPAGSHASPGDTDYSAIWNVD